LSFDFKEGGGVLTKLLTAKSWGTLTPRNGRLKNYFVIHDFVTTLWLRLRRGGVMQRYNY
jgi:hypothetical protein